MHAAPSDIHWRYRSIYIVPWYASFGVSHVGFKRLVTMIAAREGSQNGAAVKGVEVRVACFEVCGKNVFDLLKNGDKLDVREDSYGSVQVLSSSECATTDCLELDLLELIWCRISTVEHVAVITTDWGCSFHNLRRMR